MSFTPTKEPERTNMSPSIATSLTEEQWDKFHAIRKDAGLTVAQLLRQMVAYAIDGAK